MIHLKFYLAHNPKFGKNIITAYYPTIEQYDAEKMLIESNGMTCGFKEWQMHVYESMLESDEVSNSTEYCVHKCAIFGDSGREIMSKIESDPDFVRWLDSV